jgi:lipopolysaccharide transport system permease protein
MERCVSSLSTSPAELSMPAAGDYVTVLRPRGRFNLVDPLAVWRYRDLFWLLARRDVQVRYKQSALGALWAIIQPLGMMVVIAVFLGPITGVSDPVTLYAGLLPWTLFASAVNASSGSVIGNAGMVRKVYFPRVILPVAAVGAPVLDFLIGLAVFVGLMAWFATPVTPALLLLPLFTLTTLTAAVGIGLFIAAVSSTYRDFRFVVPFALQAMFFATPIILVHDQFPQWLSPLLLLNPVSGTIGGFRAAVLDQPIDWVGFIGSTAAALGCLLLGVWQFGRTERRFADVL